VDSTVGLFRGTWVGSPLGVHLLVLANVNAALLQRRVRVLFVGGGRGALQGQVDHVGLLGGAGLGGMGRRRLA